MTVAVKLKNVSKRIKNKTIIDDLSFSINHGEVFGFLGPNGAGKTTTIRMIVGLIGITSGEIEICGKNVKTQHVESMKHIGAIVENPEMYKFMSGYDNLKQYARIYGVSKEKIDEVVKFVDLSERINDKVRTYSLGMRQRLGIAQSLLHDPDVLILDEPTNGLDPAGIREMRNHLRYLAKEKNMAIIVSSHLLSEMELMCDRIAIIQKGKLINVQNIREQEQEETVAKKKYFVEVNAEQVEQVKAISAYTVEQVENGIVVELVKEEVPAFLKELITREISVYQMNILSQSLEDRFLEITKEVETSNA